jgi:hypothetical protein
LVAEDPGELREIATRLEACGCEVFCACTLDEAADLVRGGTLREFVLVQVDDDRHSPEQLRREMATRLPGWQVAAVGAPEKLN